MPPRVAGCFQLVNPGEGRVDVPCTVVAFSMDLPFLKIRGWKNKDKVKKQNKTQKGQELGLELCSPKKSRPMVAANAVTRGNGQFYF